MVQNLGKQKNSLTNGGFQTDQTDVAEMIAAAKQGTFKIKSGESMETNAPNIEKAKAAMWLNLSENSKNVLRARAAQVVSAPADIERTAGNMAASLLDPMLETDHSKTYDESLKGPGGKGAGSGKETMANMGPTEMAFHGRTNVTPISQIGSGGVEIQGMAYALPPQA